ncbi:MAG: extracellular solute-binding protein [Haloarculaceae archaeon]
MVRNQPQSKSTTGLVSGPVSRRRVLAGLGAAGVVGIAGCSSGDDDNADLTGDESELIQQAKQEDALTLYSVIDTPALEEVIIPAFQKDHPWAEVETVGLGPSEISSRISSEYQADQVQADVAWNTQTSMTPLKSQGALRNVTEISELQRAYQENDFPEYLDAEYWVPAIQNPQTVVYNTDMLSSDEVPDSYEGWTDDKWDGQLVFDEPKILNVAGGEFTSLYGATDESTWQNVMEGIAGNSPRLTQSASEAFRVVAQGEAALGIGLINNYIVGQQQDEPPAVEIAWVEPNVSLNVPLYLTKDASNPALAVLFARWLMSPSGQVAAAETGNTPTQPELAEATFSEYIPSDVELRPVASDVPSYFEEPDQWTERYQEIFG